MLSEQAEPFPGSVIQDLPQERTSRENKGDSAGAQPGHQAAPCPLPYTGPKLRAPPPHSRAMPELNSLQEPPDSHEATAGRCHPPPELTSPHTFPHSPSAEGHRGMSLLSPPPKHGQVPAATRSHPRQEHKGACPARSPRLCCHPILQTLQPRDFCIPEEHVAPAHPIPSPAAPALPLLSPECATLPSTASLSRKQEPPGESSGTGKRRRICPSALVKSQQVSVPEP